MKTLFAFSCTLFLCFTISAQTGETISLPAAQKSGGIIFEKTTHDFGVIGNKSEAECVFSFVNKGQIPIAVTGVKASCGCTAPKWSKEPVKPEAVGEIRVRYNTNITGPFNKTITVLTTADKSPIILTIKGDVRRKGK